MADDILELVKCYARPDKIHLNYDPKNEFGSIHNEDSSYGDIKPGDIEINFVYSPKQQILTLMHEILHRHPRFINRMPVCERLENYWYNSIHGRVSVDEQKKIDEYHKKYTKIDRKITRFAKHILRTRPEILRNLGDCLREVHIIDKMLPDYEVVDEMPF